MKSFSWGDPNSKDGDICLGCKKPTNPSHPDYELGHFVNRTPCDDGWLCGYCGGFECYECGEDIYVDSEVRLNYSGDSYNIHEDCAIKLIRAGEIEESDIEYGMSDWALEEGEKE